MIAPSAPTPFDLSFRLFGTRVVVNPFFWLITALLAEHLLKAEDWPVRLGLWIGAVFLSILLHEFGHVWMWRLFGVDAVILLHGWGGLAIADDDAPRRWQRVLVSFAGPLIQLALLAGLVGLWAVLYRNGQAPPFEELFRFHTLMPPPWFFLGSMVWINLAWPLLNLLPIYPLDGGQIAREACQMATNRSRMVNNRPALLFSLWLSIGTAAAAVVYILLPKFNIPQPYPLGVGPLTAVMFVMLAVNNYGEIQRMHGRRGPLDDDW